MFGLLLGQTAIKLLWRQMHLPLTNTIHLEWRVVIYMAALTLLTSIVVGIYPALGAMRRNLHGSMSGITSTASISQNRTREGLVVVQLALTLVFLMGSRVISTDNSCATTSAVRLFATKCAHSLEESC